MLSYYVGDHDIQTALESNGQSLAECGCSGPTQRIRQSPTGIPLRPVIFQASDKVLRYRKVGTSHYILPVCTYLSRNLPLRILLWIQMWGIHVMDTIYLLFARGFDSLDFDLHILLVHARIIVIRSFQ